VLIGDRDAAAALHALLEPHADLFPVIARAVACLGSASYHVGSLAALLGRREEAQARLRHAIAAGEAAGAHPHVALALVRLGTVLADGGAPDDARAALQEAAARADAAGVPAVAADARRRLGALAG